jgi:hypothetical protein
MSDASVRKASATPIGIRLWVLGGGVSLFLVLFALLAGPARAETHITADITTNTTWSPTGNPYLLDKQVKVAEGVTLTILPGTKIEFNATSNLTFFVAGTLEAVGSLASEIEFTSSQDAKGEGAPGQYRGITVQGSGASAHFAYTKFTYGGSGSGGYYAYGVLTAQSSSSLLVENSTFESNEYSGIKIGAVSSAKIYQSTIKHNGDGIAGTAAPITIAHNEITDNSEYGLHFNWLKTATAPGAEVENNEITKNGTAGIYLSGYCDAALSTFPHGSLNNIYDNGSTGAYRTDGSELRTLYPCEALNVNWEANYWGSVSLLSGPRPVVNGKFVCKTLFPRDWWVGAPVEGGHFLGYSSYDETKIPPGPISTENLPVPFPVACGDGTFATETWHAIYNSFYVNTFSPTKFVIT